MFVYQNPGVNRDLHIGVRNRDHPVLGKEGESKMFNGGRTKEAWLAGGFELGGLCTRKFSSSVLWSRFPFK